MFTSCCVVQGSTSADEVDEPSHEAPDAETSEPSPASQLAPLQEADAPQDNVVASQESSQRDFTVPDLLHGWLLTMPLLVLNLGGEMVYVLEQRLQAQKIPEERCQKALGDVVRTLYCPKFVQGLFRPQEAYNLKSTRQIFDRLAHSSVMQFNKASMDKLFDLMTMAFKYQVMSCASPAELVDVTLNHLEALRRLAGSDEADRQRLDECIEKIKGSYGRMSLAESNMIRQSVCTFFQDRKVTLTLFLQGQIQNSDGSISVPRTGLLPSGASQLGLVRYFASGEEVKREQLPMAGSQFWESGPDCRTTLGSNLYQKANSPPQGVMER